MALALPTAFSQLEDLLFDQNSETYFDIDDRLNKLNKLPDENGKPSHYGDMMRYLLSTSNFFNQYGSEEASGERLPKYAHIGGYAVLAHLIGKHSEAAIENWRTSHDLDVVAWDRQLDSPLQNAFRAEKRRSHLPCKDSYTIADPAAAIPCEVDFYYPDENGDAHINDRRLGNNARNRVRAIDIFGVPVSVVGQDD